MPMKRKTGILNLRSIIMLGYPIFLVFLEKSLRDLKIGETVEFMGVTLTAAAVGFLVPIMFHNVDIRILGEQILSKQNELNPDKKYILGKIYATHNHVSLSQYANFLFLLTFPAWFFTIIWSITPEEVVYWFGLPSSIVVGLLYFPAALLSIANDGINT
jgi:hypothetical protein